MNTPESEGGIKNHKTKIIALNSSGNRFDGIPVENGTERKITKDGEVDFSHINRGP